MSNKFDKQYFEKYARLSLDLIFEIGSKNFVCEDKPDLQNAIENIGIEVTRAIVEHEGILHGFWNKHAGMDSPGELIEQEKNKMFRTNKKKCPYKITKIGKHLTASYEPIIEKDRLIIIENVIKKKIKKCQNYEKEFCKKGLYIFAETHLLECKYFENDFIQNLKKINEYFDFLIINAISNIYFIDALNDYNIEKFSVNGFKLEELKKLASDKI